MAASSSSAAPGRMIRNQEEDEFVAVRVQDPRVQNEGSWNSYVDYKIFLHTNSKAFTAKTSCVRRRYSEFVWLKKKLQKNAGLVPVPGLPGKSLFYFNNEDFLEKRRKGLQLFLDRVVNMTVCLSDSQLHLFLQTQLPVSHIQDCVQGHTPFSVTDAILTYASSNQGLAQAQEDDAVKDPCLNISYESMESPAPHQPPPQPQSFCPGLSSCGGSDPQRGSQDRDSGEVPHGEKSSVRISQKSDHLEAVVEDSSRPEATFYLGDSSESVSSAEQGQQRLRTPVEVHSSTGSGVEDSVSEGEVALPAGVEEKVEQRDTSEEVDERKVNREPEKCDDSEEILDFKENYCEEQILESEARSQGAVEVVCTENPIISQSDEVHVPHVKADEQGEPDEQKGRREETPLGSEGHDEVDSGEGKQEVDFTATRDTSEKGSCSEESIEKISDEETDDSVQDADSFGKMPPEDDTCRVEEVEVEVEASSRSISGPRCPVEEQHHPAPADLQSALSGPRKSVDLSSAAASGGPAEN